jgi:chromatin structure-remodeling complex protein RSC7
MHYPAIMQPTHAHWEHIPPSHPDVHSEPTPSTRLLTNGTVPEPSTDAPTHNDNHNTLFKPPTDFMYRNLLTVDVAYRTPTVANAALPSLKNAFGGAIAAPSLSEVHDDVLAELPRECREAFEKERQKELDWRAQWGNETQHGARADIKITF